MSPPRSADGPAGASRPALGTAIAHMSAFLLGHPAARGARLGTIARALAWQVAYRLRGSRRALVECDRMRLWAYPGSTGATGVLYVGLPEWDEMNFVLRFLRAGDHFVDAGANVGSFTVLAARQVPGVRVTAIEPGEPALTRLRENLALNGLDHVRVVDCAIGDAAGTISFTRGRDTVNRIAIAGDEDRVEVRMTTFDELFGSDPPALVKLDLEGAELRAIRGGAGMLSGPRAPVILLEWLYELGLAEGVEAGEVAETLRGFGYRLAVYDADTNRLTPWVPGEPTKHKHRVAVRDLDAAAARLEQGAANGMRAPVRVRARFDAAAPAGPAT